MPRESPRDKLHTNVTSLFCSDWKRPEFWLFWTSWVAGVNLFLHWGVFMSLITKALNLLFCCQNTFRWTLQRRKEKEKENDPSPKITFRTSALTLTARLKTADLCQPQHEKTTKHFIFSYFLNKTLHVPQGRVHCYPEKGLGIKMSLRDRTSLVLFTHTGWD